MAGALRQSAAIFVFGQVLFAIGFNLALNNIIVVQVPMDADRFMDDEQMNWTLAVYPLVSLLGSLLSLSIAGRLGAKRLLMLAMPVYALASLMGCFGGTFVLVLMSRSVMCTMVGMVEGGARGYLAEIVPPNRRALTTAVLNAFGFAMQAVGLLVGKYVHWTWMFLISGFVPSALCLVGLCGMPNSAKWLLSHGHSEEEARQSLHFFRGQNHNVDAEVNEIIDSVAHAHIDGESIPAWKLLFHRSTLVPLLLICTQMTLSIWTGGMAISFITAYILEPVQLPLDAYQSAMIPAVLSAIVGIPCSYIIECYGRLPLLRFSGGVSLAGCAAIAAYFFLSPQLQKDLGLMALAGAATAQLAFSALLLPISLVYINELLPNRTRILGANISMGCTYGQTFLLTKLYPLLKDAIGFNGTFIVHAMVSALQVPFATFCLPETRGLSLEQVQRLFAKGATDSELPLEGFEKGGERDKSDPALDPTDLDETTD